MGINEQAIKAEKTERALVVADDRVKMLEKFIDGRDKGLAEHRKTIKRYEAIIDKMLKG